MRLFPKNSSITAVDFGSDTIKVVVGEHSPTKNTLTIRASGKALSSSCISNGLIMDMESARECLIEALKDAGITINSNKDLFQNTIVGFEHPQCQTTIEEIHKEFKSPTFITEDHIAELKKSIASKIQMKYKQESFLTKIYIYEWFCNDTHVYSPLGMKVRKLTLRAYFSVVQELLTNNCHYCIEYIPPFDSRRNIFYAYTPIALVFSTASPVETQLGSLIIDIGKDNTSLIITKNRKIVLAKTISSGISKILPRLSITYKIDFEEAKKLIYSYGVSPEIVNKIDLTLTGNPSNISNYDFSKIPNLIPSSSNPVMLHNGKTPPRSEIEFIITISLFEIFHGIYYDHLYKKNLTDQFNYVILTGGGALTPNLVPLVEKVFDMTGRVKIGFPTGIPDIPPNTNSPIYAPVLGLLKYSYSELLQSQKKKSPFSILKQYIPSYIQNVFSL